MKNNVYPCKPQFYYIKWDLRGSKLYRYVFVMEHKKSENQRLGFTNSLHIQQCNLRGCICPLAPALAVFDFQFNQDKLNDPKRNKNKIMICTVMKYGVMFYGHHKALDINCSEHHGNMPI